MLTRKRLLTPIIFKVVLSMLLLTDVSAEQCPKIGFLKELELPLNKNERSLLCPRVKEESSTRGQIPHYQAKFYLKGFLQSRGHLMPEFETRGTKLIVHPKAKSSLKSVSITPNAPEVVSELQRFYKGRTVTPMLLNDIESFVARLYKEKAHPCPSINTSFNPENDKLTVSISDLQKKKFGEIDADGVTGLDKNFIKRFNAFKPDQFYHPLKLELTQKRIHRSRIVQSTYYQTSCHNPQSELKIKQSFVPGAPRTLRFGLGLNTEVGPITRVRWTHHRYKEMGSTLQANLQASLKEQSLNLGSEIFTSPQHPRRSWKSEFLITRTSESDFDELKSEVGQKIKWTRDGPNHYWSWQTGPALTWSWFKTDENKKRRSLVTPSWQFSFQVQSHLYESYDLFPQEGHKIQVQTDMRPTWVGSEFDIYQFELKAIKLFPLSTWGRGDLIAGVRFNFQSTWVDDQTDISSVPPGLRFYGGGESTNRGHRLNSLPGNNGLGALGHSLMRFELRRTNAFTETLEILAFTDYSQFSERPWRLEKTKWVSPGIGVRWLSPIGPVQAYAARALQYEPYKDDGNFFYIGLGGEL